jgi:protein-S-isoprenylcysteine O-methyltransferase Ste14
MNDPKAPLDPVAGKKVVKIPAAVMIAAACGAVIGAFLVRKGSAPPPPHSPLLLGSPMALSLYCWLALSAYWSWAARGASAANSAESQGSRLLHVLLINASVILTFWPFDGWPRAQFGGFQFPRVLPASPVWAALGLALSVLGLGLAVWARRCLGRHWSAEVTAKVDHELVRTGPYRRIRHPIYTGAIAMYLGPALIAGRLQGVLALIVVGIAYARKIAMEERNLRALFGPAWDDYVRQTGALLPRRP